MTLKKVLRQNETYLFIIVLLFVVVITLINPVFLSLNNVFDLLRSSSGTAILALGIFIVLVSGGFDVSSTAIAISAQYITVTLFIAHGMNNIYLAFLIAIAIGIILGAINAVFIAFLNLPTLIVTLGTSSLFHGALLTFIGTKSVNIGDLPKCFKDFGSLNIINLQTSNNNSFGLSIFFLVLVILVVLTWFILRHTMIGRGIYAVGGNIEAARQCGFNVKRIQFFIYCYVGFLAGIVGILHLCLIRYSNPNYLVGTEMSIIAAVVLGGTRITGGTGTVFGTLVGVALVVILQKNLVLLGLSAYWEQFFVGFIIILGVSITYGHISEKISHFRKRLRYSRSSKQVEKDR